MPQLSTILQENKRERERLLGLMAGLKEADFAKRLPNGWSVSVALAHLAFWDLSMAARLNNWLHKGVKPVWMDAEAVNGPLARLSEALPPKVVIQLATEAAETVDGIVEKLTQAQADELLKIGPDRFLRRALHRQEHLDKIETALKS